MEHAPRGLGRFGTAADIAVQRGISEFQAARPILVSDAGSEIAVLPVDGLADAAWEAFQALVAPAAVKLAITARRAHVIGLDAPGPVLIGLGPSDTPATVWALSAGLRGELRPAAEAGGEAVDRAIELAKLAQRLPALLVADAGAIDASSRADMIKVRADAIARVRARILDTLEIVSEARIPLSDGITARFSVFRDAVGDSPVAIILGEPDLTRPVHVRVHSACLTGDVFGSRRCDCGAQLKLAVAQLSETGGGIVLYLEQEGRGLGLANKMRAYMLQDGGLDTMDANMMLGFDDDERNFAVAARMLKMIGVTRVMLLTNNPGKLEALSEGGVEVLERIPLHTPVNADNRRYIATKAARAGHWLDDMLAAGNEPDRNADGGQETWRTG